MSSIRYNVYILLYFAHVAFSALQFQQPEDLLAAEYDFIIAGGGTAGIVVASRLSENHDLKVLIIEAGPSNDEIFDSQVPGLRGNLEASGSRVDWNYTSVPQVHVNGNVFVYQRAMMLGGCSSYNGMAHTRGSRDDYDRWASIADDDDLSWNKILPYILKTERWSGPNDPNLSEQGHFDPSVHNFHGKVELSGAYGLHPFNDLLFEATDDPKGEFPFLLDQNAGRPIGISWGQFSVANGTRSSSATAYLPHTGDNLHVLLNTRVTRILPVDRGDVHGHDGSPDFRTVEFAASAEAPRLTVTATKEVIVSGGAINSPQILLNSGIGPKNDLEKLGIHVAVDNPSVGQNFTDQVAIGITFATNLPTTDFNETAAFTEWTTSHTGPLARPLSFGPLGFVRLPNDAAVFRGSPDPTAGPNSPHIELEFTNIIPQSDSVGIRSPSSGSVKGQDGNNTLRTNVVNLHPFSRGSITLNSSSPFAPPLIDMNLLGSPFDEAILIEGVLSMQRLFALPAFSKNVFGLTAPAPSSGPTPTKEEIARFIETQAIDYSHGSGSCSMAPRGAQWGVVGPDFRVRGARGLRVVDASVMPYMPSGHTDAPIYALAEWASAVIQRSWE